MNTVRVRPTEVIQAGVIVTTKMFIRLSQPIFTLKTYKELKIHAPFCQKMWVTVDIVINNLFIQGAFSFSCAVFMCLLIL